MIEAGDGDSFEELRLGEMLRRRLPSGRTDHVLVDEIVDQRDQRPLVGRPAGGIGRAVHQRGDLAVAEVHALAEQGDVDAPFVFAAEPRRRAVDQDLALAQAERALVEKAAGEDPAEDAGTACQGAEQQQRLDGGMMRSSSVAIAGS